MRLNKIYNLIIYTALLSFFCACADEMERNMDIEEGIPTIVSMSFKANEVPEISTKSAINEEEESKVHDLWVLVFAENGGAWTLEDKKEVDVSSNSFSMTLQSGKKRIYGIANAKGSSFRLENAIENIHAFSDLESLTARMEQGDLFRSGSLLMCGAIVDNGSDMIAIQPSTRSAGTIELRRIDSRIQFKVECTKGQFIPKTWYVVNAPVVTYVKERTYSSQSAGSDAMAAEGDYFNSEPRIFEEITQNDFGGGSFVFYMAENRKPAKGNINKNEYEKREKQDPDKTGDDRDYVYADQKASYVVMTGTYIGTDEKGTPLTADVKYTVHLGYVNGDATDFRNERNYLYTYKVQISGVDQIIYEVVKKEEKQPGAEGDVIQAQSQYFVDAHYGVNSITFNKAKVSENASFMVKTPYDAKGVYKYGESSPQDYAKAVDYEWVRFSLNEKVGNEYSTKYHAYPKDGKGVKNIKEVIEGIMNGTIEADKKGNIIFTVFIDEFYYDTYPDGKNGKPSWKEFVNIPNREMHILCNTEYSPDKESSLTTSSFMISQRSIKTFYDVNNVSTAWGIETEREGTRVRSTLKGDSLLKNNGYAALATYTNKAWATYINSEDNMLKSQQDDNVEHYLSAYACLQRNRDLDGDGTIDADEIKWYMPSVKQMTGLWLGKDALPSETHLVQNGTQSLITNDLKAYIYHFIASDNMVFWAEEGSSTSDNSKAHGLNIKWRNSSNSELINMTSLPSSGRYYDYRCVRNLNDHSISEIPEEYVDYQNYVFSLTKVNANALKSSVSYSQQSVENELHSNNRPYKRFQVAKNEVKNNGETYNRQYVLNGNNPCLNYSESDSNIPGAGAWRMPNQREISLICAYPELNQSTTFLFSNTKSSLPTRTSSSSTTQNYTSIYSIQNQNPRIITLSGGQGFVRCVRDLP